MLDPEDRRPLRAQLAHRRDELVHLRLGQTAGDLVEQERARLRHDRTRELEALALEQRQRAGEGVGLAGESRPSQDLDAHIVRIALRPPPTERGPDQDVLEHGHPDER